MKKLLLFSAVAGMAFSAGAQQFSELYKVTANNKTVEYGETLYFSDHDDLMTYDAKITVTPLDGETREMRATFSGTGAPSVSEITSGEWGNIAFCFETSEGGGNCLNGSTINKNILGQGTVSVPGDGYLTWDIHNYFYTREDKSTYKLQMFPIVDGQEIDDFFECLVVYDPSGAGVATVEIDENLPVEYFDMAGRKVLNPSKGIYLLRQNGKTVKRVIK